MNLDDYQNFNQIDKQDMLGHINGLPDQLEQAWKLGHELPLPSWTGIQRVLVTGMGGSAIGGDLVAAYVEPTSPVPLAVVRDYNLPAWARGAETLVIASSHSGNTEETLSAYKSASQRGCTRLAVCTGGELARLASADQAAGQNVALWVFEHRGQPRTAVGFSFGLLLSALARLGLTPDPTAELHKAITAMRKQQEVLAAAVPVVNNLAKRQAGQLMGRWVAIFGSGILAPVARRWKGQVSELAKAWAQFEALPEADHNTLAGSLYPAEVIPRTLALFLRGAADHPRNALRIAVTKRMLMLDGLSTDFIDAQGVSPLENLWTALHLGDYIAYYLAMLYEVDPTPIAALQNLKQELAGAA
jgi:glucose/mannose-6-phosphate isomerase